jgi:hypothetical protein
MQLFEHLIHARNEQELFVGMLAVAIQPVDNSDHLIVEMKRVCESQQDIARGFDPHDEAPRRMIRVFEEEMGEKFRHFLRIQVIGIAQSAVYIET